MVTSFDKSKAYMPKDEGTFFDDGREEDLTDYILTQRHLQGDPAAIIAAIDKYGRTQKYLMNVGEDKGKIVTDAIRERKPTVMVELGAYVGYSTILFASAFREAGGTKYYSIERSRKFADNVAKLVKFAGLFDVVEIVIGPSSESIKALCFDGKLSSIDTLFLDHYKPAYLSDLKLCESLGLIKEGTWLVADNVITPGNPPYLEYVRASSEEKRSKLHRRGERASNVGELFPQRSAAQYGKVEEVESDAEGNPNLVYESRLVHSYEPSGEEDGIEITRCVAVGS